MKIQTPARRCSTRLRPVSIRHANQACGSQNRRVRRYPPLRTQPVVGAAPELRPDLFGIRMAEFLEGVQSLLPGRSRGVEVARVVVGVAEIDQSPGLPVPVAEPAPQLEGALVAGDRLVVMTELVVCVAQAVPAVDQLRLVLELPVHVEGLLAVGECLLMVAEPGVVPAREAQRLGLAEPVPEGAEQPEGLFGVGERLGGPALGHQGPPPAEMGPGPPG